MPYLELVKANLGSKTGGTLSGVISRATTGQFYRGMPISRRYETQRTAITVLEILPQSGFPCFIIALCRVSCERHCSGRFSATLGHLAGFHPAPRAIPGRGAVACRLAAGTQQGLGRRTPPCINQSRVHRTVPRESRLERNVGVSPMGAPSPCFLSKVSLFMPGLNINVKQR